MVGNALQFDAARLHVKMENSLLLDGNCTLSALIKHSQVKSRSVLYGENGDIFLPYMIFGSFAVNHTSDCLSLAIANQRRLLHNRGIDTLSSVTLPFSTDQWHHVVGAVDRDNEEMCVYLGGKLVGI